MREDLKIGVIILAGGSSSRLGYPKQLIEFRGESLLQHTIDVSVAQSFNPCILVLGARSNDIKSKIDARNFVAVTNENWKEGIGSSLGKGMIEVFKIEQEIEHVLVLLSDQPFITAKSLGELIDVHLKSNSPATFSKYSGEVGVPAIFSRILFPHLQELKGDHGAKKLLRDNNFKYDTVPFEDGNFDVDTKEDVDSLKRMENSGSR